jgi:hypothetical protein
MSEAVPTLPKAPPRRRRWLRRTFLFLLIVIGSPIAYYFYSSWSLQRDIERAIAETDALDPRWRWEDIEADRKEIAAAENSAGLVVTVNALIGRGRRAASGDPAEYQKVFGNLPPAAELNPQQMALLRETLDKAPEALVEARKLKDLPHGRLPLTRDPSGLWFLLPERQEIRNIFELLHHDALLKAHFGDPDAALDSCIALLNAGRSLEEDPFLISFIIRFSGDAKTAEAVERTLAQGYPKEPALREVQKCVRTERDSLQEHFILAIRGERAEFDRFFQPLIQGRIRWSYVTDSMRVRVPLIEPLKDYLPTLVTKDYPQGLRARNKLVEAARLPLHQQAERFAALEATDDRGRQRNIGLGQILPLAPPDLTRVCLMHLRAHAFMAATEGGLACERFRLAKKRWPESLDEVVKTDFLDAVPTDPFDGQLLRFARLKDGVVIYAVGPDKQDNGGNIQRVGLEQPGSDVGFRLWDPPQRRQPPRPPVPLE